MQRDGRLRFPPQVCELQTTAALQQPGARDHRRSRKHDLPGPAVHLHVCRIANGIPRRGSQFHRPGPECALREHLFRAAGRRPAHLGKNPFRTAPQTAFRGHELRAADGAAQPRKRLGGGRKGGQPRRSLQPGPPAGAPGLRHYRLWLPAVSRLQRADRTDSKKAQGPGHQRHRRPHGGQPGASEPDRRCRSCRPISRPPFCRPHRT